MKKTHKWYDFLTLYISYGIRVFKIYKNLIKAMDLNKDGKVSKQEVLTITQEILNGDTKIEFIKLPRK